MSHATTFIDRGVYFAGIDRNDAVRLLREDGRDGTFLLRDSGSAAGQFTVSVLRCQSGSPGGTVVRHIRIIIERGEYLIERGGEPYVAKLSPSTESTERPESARFRGLATNESSGVS